MLINNFRNRGQNRPVNQMRGQPNFRPNQPNNHTNQLPPIGFNMQNPLPDGVTLTPLTNEMLKNGFANFTPNNSNEPPKNNSNGQPVNNPAQAIPKNNSSVFESLIQNEKNSAVFYEYMENSAPNEYLKGIFSNIRESAFKKENFLKDMYREMSNIDFNGENKEIINSESFTNGVLTAIYEENNMIGEVIDYFHSQNSYDNKIASYIFDKFTRINMLQYAYNLLV